jgi:hypothetical protein
MGSGFFREWCVVFIPGSVRAVVLVLVLMMSEMLTCLARLVHAIRARHSPADLENECKGYHVEKAFDHGADYISYSGASRLNLNGKRSSGILDVIIIECTLLPYSHWSGVPPSKDKSEF